MRGFYIFLIFLLAQTAGAQTFRVATFNVESYLDVATGHRRVKSEAAKAKVRECILAIKPDVIALEEMGTTNALLELQGALKADGLDLPYWEHVSGRDPTIHVAFLSRFPIIERRPHTNENFLLGGRRMQVSRGFAEIEVEAECGKVTLIAAHLKSKLTSPEADEAEWRLAEAEALRRIVDERLTVDPEINLVVLGDFNDLKDSKPVKTIIGQGKTKLFDTRPAERNGDDQKDRRVTWTEHYVAEDLYSRIDYILISHALKKIWQPDGTWILNLPNWGVASDHRAIVASFMAGRSK